MLYKFDKKLLVYKEVPRTRFMLKYTGIILGILVLLGLFQGKTITTKDELTEEELMIIVSDYNVFSEERLIAEIERRNFRFPHIVYAQSILETGKFTSDIFKYNNNLFGMKEARVRVNTAIKTERGHAYYANWRESLEDYGYYYSTYLSKIRTEDEYYDYLSQHYAEVNNYVQSVKRIVENHELKKVFGINEEE